MSSLRDTLSLGVTDLVDPKYLDLPDVAPGDFSSSLGYQVESRVSDRVGALGGGILRGIMEDLMPGFQA